MKRRGPDLAAPAPCLPGARLTGSEGDICWGKTKVKVGRPPAVVSGTSEVVLGVAVVVDVSDLRLVR